MNNAKNANSTITLLVISSGHNRNEYENNSTANGNDKSCSKKCATANDKVWESNQIKRRPRRCKHAQIHKMPAALNL